MRLAHNGTRFGPVCLSDSYPKPGFHFNHREKMLRPEPSGDGMGNSKARLGGWVPLAGGFLMSFASPEGRASTDVALLEVDNRGGVSTPRWLSDTPSVNEDAPHLARYGQNAFLASWTSGQELMLAEVDADGEILGGPAAAPAKVAARDDFQTMADGSVAWATAWDDMSKLKVVRVAACTVGSGPGYQPTE